MSKSEKIAFIKHLVDIGEISSAEVACYDWNISTDVVEQYQNK